MVGGGGGSGKAYLLNTCENVDDCKQLFKHSNLSTFYLTKLCVCLFRIHSYEEDEWTETALDCLEFCPKGLSGMQTTSLTNESTELHKIKLFQTIADYYMSLTQPLWPDSFTDLQVALLDINNSYNVPNQYNHSLVV